MSCLLPNPASPVSANAGSKRVTGNKRERDDWQTCEDVDELKQVIADRDADINKLLQQVRELRKEGVEDAEDAPLLNPPKPLSEKELKQQAKAREKAAKELEKQAKKHRMALRKGIAGQMVYSQMFKDPFYTARVAAEIPDISIEEAKAVLGPELSSAASEAPHQLKVEAPPGELAHLFAGKIPGKALRFGSSLELIGKMDIVYHKAYRLLSVSGNFCMLRTSY